MKKRYILVACLACVLLAVLILAVIVLSRPQLQLNCASDDPTVLAEISHIADRLNTIGLRDSRIDNHIQRLCDGEVTSDVLYTYADQLEMLNEIGLQVGEPIPVDVWDEQPRDMNNRNIDVYQNIAALSSQPDYIQLLIRAYNRFYTFNQNPSTNTALDTGLDIFLYTVEYYDQITDADFDTLDTESVHELGIEIVKTWQELIGYTFRINPLTGDPLFPSGPYTHFNVTNMWRNQVRTNASIGRIWGTSGFDLRFVGNARQNNNQMEHVAVSLALQYVYDQSLMVLNALEVRDTMNGKQEAPNSVADQAVNNVIAYEFIPYFEEGYVQAIERLRCVLSTPAETTSCG